MGERDAEILWLGDRDVVKVFERVAVCVADPVMEGLAEVVMEAVRDCVSVIEIVAVWDIL